MNLSNIKHLKETLNNLEEGIFSHTPDTKNTRRNKFIISIPMKRE